MALDEPILAVDYNDRCVRVCQAPPTPIYLCADHSTSVGRGGHENCDNCQQQAIIHSTAASSVLRYQVFKGRSFGDLMITQLMVVEAQSERERERETKRIKRKENFERKKNSQEE